MQIEARREEYYRQLGIPPGIPTMKGEFSDFKQRKEENAQLQ